MPQLIWTQAALRDISRLHGFLSAKSPQAAQRAVGTIRQGIKLLGDHPEVGRPLAEMRPEFREWPISFGAGGYVVVYRIDEDAIVVLAVRHSRESGTST